jgi:hypothetical protein
MRLWLWSAAAGGVLVIACGATIAQAELLRCKGPDGRMIYTDDKSRCPGADPFEPSGEVQRAEEPESSGAASRAPLDDRVERARARRRAAEAEQGEARRWRQKREEAEQQLEHLARRRLELDEFVTWCNRGGSVVTRDVAGIKRNVPCRTIRAEFEELDTKEAKVRAYLESGLAEECRRAGCLPGWIR